MSVVTKLLCGGPKTKFRVLAVANRVDDKLHCPVFEFLEDARRDHSNSFERLWALLEYTAEHGPPVRHDTKFKHLTGTDGLFEFKAKSLRLYCFYDKDCIIVCTSGSIKKADKTHPKELRRAQDWKTSYAATKNSGKLIHESDE